jgi:hypothetical protein
LSEGQARAITFGGTWGTWQGFGWAHVFDWGAGKYCNGDACYDDSDPSTKAAITSAVLGGLAGLGVGAAMMMPATMGR